VICDTNGLPWTDNEYRRKWRLVADAAGVPKTTRNMDSRAGGITEATEAGADIEHVKHAATHSDISQTQRYSRGATEKIAEVQKKRNDHRFRRSG
jgi:site-specific recombinase XerD